MPAPSIKSLDVDALLTLRAQIDTRLTEKRHELETQLARLGMNGGRGAKSQKAAAGLWGATGGRTNSLKGRKVAPKYRGPDGETWAGRGAQPVWLRDELKAGAKLENFLIDKTSAARKS